MTKIIKNTAPALGEALAEGAVIIPNIIFAGLLYQHYGHYHFLLPFVLLYSFEKAGSFALQGFGKLKNLYKILRYSLLLAILGCCLCLFGNVHFIFWEAGAVLTGLGLSNYNALFKTIKDYSAENNNQTKKGVLIKGYLILGIIIALLLSLRHVSITFVFAIFLMILLMLYTFISQLEWESGMHNQAAFEKKRKSWLHFLPAGCMLLFAFFTRLLKQTANSNYILYVGLALCLFLIVGLIFNPLTFSLQALYTMWFGAARNFLVIYSLIYFIAINKLYMVGLSYIMIVLGLFLSMAAQKYFKAIKEEQQLQIIFLVSSMACFLFLLSPWTYLLGILLSCAFIASGNRLVLQNYITDNRLPTLERRVIRSKFYGLGAIIQQVVLLSTLIAVSWIKNHNSALSAYSLADSVEHIQGAFFCTKLICLAFIVTAGLFLVRLTLKHMMR